MKQNKELWRKELLKLIEEDDKHDKEPQKTAPQNSEVHLG